MSANTQIIGARVPQVAMTGADRDRDVFTSTGTLFGSVQFVSRRSIQHVVLFDEGHVEEWCVATLFASLRFVESFPFQQAAARFCARMQKRKPRPEGRVN